MRFAPLTEAEAGRAIWSAVSAAIIAQAAMQLSRMASLDRPLGTDFNGLDLVTARSHHTATSATFSHPVSSTPGRHGHQAQFPA